MDWFRSYHGAPSDTKLRIIARNSEQPRSVVTAVWWCLLDYASQNSPRGSLDGIDYEVIAMDQEMECHAVSHIVTAMIDKKMIKMSEEGMRLSAWDDRQPKREDATGTERKRKSRELKRDHALQSVPEISVTQCHTVSQNVTIEERREEEIRGVSPQPPFRKNSEMETQRIIHTHQYITLERKQKSGQPLTETERIAMRLYEKNQSQALENSPLIVEEREKINQQKTKEDTEIPKKKYDSYVTMAGYGGMRLSAEQQRYVRQYEQTHNLPPTLDELGFLIIKKAQTG